MANESYDYIIVGAGASGAVLANRLSADANNRVLLLEAGEIDAHPDVQDPGGFVRLWGSPLDWAIPTTEQPGLLNRSITINQGKVLGGSTAINAMMYVRGNPGNFDEWNALGADGWSFQDVLPYFKKSEDFEEGESEYHGAGGPLRIRVCPDDDMRSEPFMNAATELGFDGPYWDYNGARQENGAGLLQFHIAADGKRASSAAAFLHPVGDRSNLIVRAQAQVTHVIVEDGKAKAVSYLAADGATVTVQAEKEIVISAGAFLSPAILLRSGIGPADELRALGIAPRADLPGVGRNLQDHLQLPVIYRSKVDHPRTTLLTGNVLFTKTREGMSAATPDLQLNFTPAIPKPLAPVLPDLGGPVAIFLPILVRPFSVGTVTLKSADPLAYPNVDPHYLECEADIRVLRQAVKLCRDLANTSAFSSINGGELAPGDEVDGYIRSQASTLWHPAGTCKIGHDKMAVVDPRLRVYGVEKLRVADASVMPTVTSGNTVAACFMIGEKAADMILSDNS